MTGEEYPEIPDDDPYDIEVEILDAEGVKEMIANALAQAGFTWEELDAQARDGRFATYEARLAWMVVSTFFEPLPT